MNKHTLNKEIEAFIDQKDYNNQNYSVKDIEYIRQYTGAGGKASSGAKGSGILHEFYTPVWLAEYMFKLAKKNGYHSGTVLEPSCATGNIIAPLPDKTKVTGFEINHYTKRIAEITYPEAAFYENFFETAFLQQPRFTVRVPANKTTWLKGYPFSLVIGNPPYGINKNKYSSYFKTPKFKQIEFFFIYYGLKLLKKNGLLIYLISQNFMRNGLSYNKEKDTISQIAEFVDAYRLPKVFESSDVPTDIIILKKK